MSRRGSGVRRRIFTGFLSRIALEGDPKPDTASTYGSDVSDASLSDNGRVTFIDTASPTGVFVNALTAGGPAPILGYGMLIVLTLLLVGLGVMTLRGRQA